MAKKESKKKTGFSAAVILLAILVITIIFIVEKDKIITNLKETHFFDRVFGSTPEFVENHPSVERKDPDKIPLTEEGTITIKVETEKPAKPVVKEEQPVEKTEKPSAAKPETPKTESPVTPVAEKPASTPVKTETKPETQKETKTETSKITYTELQLCFVEIDSEGSINRKIIKRSIPKNDSPLTTSLQLLLAGPDTTKSAEKNCMSLIPQGSKLLSAKVKDGVAILNFNSNFEINNNGVEGYNGQLMQIVYTATAFSTVNSVQFLIEGEKQEYLSEGIWIGSPLSRNSF